MVQGVSEGTGLTNEYTVLLFIFFILRKYSQSIHNEINTSRYIDYITDDEYENK